MTAITPLLVSHLVKDLLVVSLSSGLRLGYSVDIDFADGDGEGENDGMVGDGHMFDLNLEVEKFDDACLG